ncbi:sigma factor-like helix-turn-helix DNA-binding protein [Pseudonocardia sp. ICBG1142]|uniref:sigma factor-like helix-turn-helix DNA-binding protein n=1 Tax=Pseudonocardia sp. ICBG1142 TaxID=2846760 RepID=UPI001CF714B1
MPALEPCRRATQKTAQELAEEAGFSRRTVVRLIAEPRADYERRARRRRATVVELRLQGLTYREIADSTGDSIGAVGRLLADARRSGEWMAATRRRSGHTE